MMYHQKVILLIGIVSVLLNIILGRYLLSGRVDATPEYHPPAAAFDFLSPRIFLENQNEIIVNFVKLRQDMRDYAENKPGLGIYFEYLPSGISSGINEKQSYVLASLLKTPMVMAVYKQIESGAWKKDDVLTIEPENLDAHFGEVYKRGAGAKITLNEAIHETLINSDNTAKSVIFSHLHEGALEDIFDYLDIPKELEGVLPVVTPKNYSSILRSLYLSSYLEKESSNEILELLTQTPFDDKLAAPIPKEVKVAHKIGVYERDNPDQSVFTDCGIIFVPKRPYILCLMDRDSETNARIHMSEVSKLVYSYVSTYQK